ncbi:hypothetical protein TM7_0640 [candidate division TM7 genomosp. GTL1]|nr:hypothetical protein TM7_0640 [candidate division TM7 genomosp. GTL1]
MILQNKSQTGSSEVPPLPVCIYAPSPSPEAHSEALPISCRASRLFGSPPELCSQLIQFHVDPRALATDNIRVIEPFLQFADIVHEVGSHLLVGKRLFPDVVDVFLDPLPGSLRHRYPSGMRLNTLLKIISRLAKRFLGSTNGA